MIIKKEKKLLQKCYDGFCTKSRLLKYAPNKHTFSDENVVNIEYHSSYAPFSHLTMPFYALASSDFTSA